MVPLAQCQGSNPLESASESLTEEMLYATKRTRQPDAETIEAY